MAKTLSSKSDKKVPKKRKHHAEDQTDNVCPSSNTIPVDGTGDHSRFSQYLAILLRGEAREHRLID
ncbi:hypothetical protein DPV78_005820 [Talaromyces pinophilus]|nr:hypothetical protein DPV78_005820 [Talaromyces pinophilus]